MLKGMTSTEEKERLNYDSFDTRLGILDSDLNLHLRIGENAGENETTITETSLNTQTTNKHFW